MIQDKIFFDEKDPTGVSYNTPFTVYGSYEGRLWSKTPTGSIKFYTQNSDLSVYATTGSNQFSGSQTVTGSLTVTGGITGSVTTASYVEYTGVANKPALVSGSSQVTYSGLTGVPAGIVSSSAQVGGYNVFATTGSNQFNGSQAVTGSLTVTGQVVAQTLNVQQVTSSIVYSSGSNIFGNTLGNTQQFTGSVSVTGSLTTSIAAFGSAATTFLTSDGGTIKSRTAAQTLSDIAALPLAGGTLTGALSGSSGGFSGNLTFAEFKSDTNVFKSNKPNEQGAFIRAAVSIASNPTFAFEDDQDTGMYRVTTNSLGFTTGGTNALTLASTGAATFASSGSFGGGTLNGANFIIKGQNGVPATSGTITTAVFRVSSGTGLYNVLDFGTNESLDYSWIQSTRANSLGTYDKLLIQPNGGHVLIGQTVASGATNGIYFRPGIESGFIVTSDVALQLSRLGTTGDIQTFYSGSTRVGKIAVGSSTVTFESNANGGITINSSGNVGIGTASPSTRLHVTNTSAGESRVALFLNNNSTTLNTETRLAFAANSNDEVSSNRYSYISALNTSSSNGQALLFATNETGAAAVERMRITSGGTLAIGTTDIPTLSTPNGGQLIVMPNAVIVSGIIALGSPYTQNIQIDIVYNNWGGNNVIGLVDMIITLREYANVAGTAFGKVFAVNGGSGATFTSFNTTDVTTSQCSVTATSGGNYTLRITIDPSNVTDRGSFYLTIPNAGGTGSSINSITISYV